MPASGKPRLSEPAEHFGQALSDKLNYYAELVRTFSESHFAATMDFEPFYGMMAYHLGWVDKDFHTQGARTGKNLRPNLCLLLAEGLGATPAVVAPLAAGIELLHNFSLIHDDIQDKSKVRRGRPTVWTVWGVPQAINAGDAMFSLAHAAWLGSELGESDPMVLVAILRSLERTVLQLCEGQYLDMAGEGSIMVSTDAYLAMIGRKTAALIGEAAWVGTRTATDDRVTLGLARAFGYELGLAFQIRDDILGIWGDESVTGKSTSSDIAARKMTLPVIAALESGPQEARAELLAYYGGASLVGEARVRALLEIGDAYARASEHEDRRWKAAMEALEALPLPRAWRGLLQEFANSFVGRRA